MNLGKISPETAQRYLLNAIAELRDGVLSKVDEEKRTRANECLEVLARVAVGLNPAPADADDGWKSEAAHLDESESRVQELLASKGGAEETFDREGLEAWLKSRLPGASQLRLTAAKVLQGGRSKQTVLLSQSGFDAFPENLVLRRDLNASLIGTSVTSEHDLLVRLQASGMRVPRVLLMNDGQDPIGSPFILVERLPGRPRGDFFNAPTDPEVVLQLADQLGALHRLRVDDFTDCKGLRSAAVDASSLASDLESLRQDLARHGDGGVIESAAYNWLSKNVSDAEPMLSLVHGDLGFHNILVQEGRLTGLLDWELAHIGHPAEDLGYVRHAVERVVDWNRFMERYRASGAPVISDAAIDFYSLWVVVRFYALAARVRSGVAAGAVPGLDLTLTSVLFPPSLARLMARYLTQFGE